MKAREEFHITVSEERGLKTRWFETKDGKCWYLPERFEWAYDARIDVNKPCICKGDGALPQLQDLVKDGFLTEKHCYEEYTVNMQEQPDAIDPLYIQCIFIEHGYNVTEEAVMHNFKAWKKGYKSGFRDEKNGYHLFTPDGMNYLSFRLTTLHPLCEDWQTTYQA